MEKNTKTQTLINLILSIMLLLGSAFTAGAVELRLLEWEGYAPPEQVKQFQTLAKEKFGVDVTLTVTHVSAAEEFYKALKSKKVDIISPGHNLPKDPRYKLITNKLTLPIDLNNVPNYANIIPALQHAEYCTIDSQVYSVPMVYGPYGLAYNSDKVKSPPTSWNVLWDPQYAGNYTISKDYVEANIYITALAMGVDRNLIGDYNAIQSPEFVAKLKNLLTNAKSMWVGVDNADDLQGLPLATAWGFSFPELKKRGENWKMANPKEGTTGWVDGWMLGHTLRNNPQLKRIAEEWLNFVLSPNFQIEVVVRGLGSAPVNLSIKDQLNPDEVKMYHVDDPDYFQKNLILWPVLDNRSRTGFKLLAGKASK